MKLSLRNNLDTSKLDSSEKCIWWWALIQLSLLSLKPVAPVTSFFADNCWQSSTVRQAKDFAVLSDSPSSSTYGELLLKHFFLLLLLLSTHKLRASSSLNGVMKTLYIAAILSRSPTMIFQNSSLNTYLLKSLQWLASSGLSSDVLQANNLYLEGT